MLKLHYVFVFWSMYIFAAARDGALETRGPLGMSGDRMAEQLFMQLDALSKSTDAILDASNSWHMPGSLMTAQQALLRSTYNNPGKQLKDIKCVGMWPYTARYVPKLATQLIGGIQTPILFYQTSEDDFQVAQLVSPIAGLRVYGVGVSSNILKDVCDHADPCECHPSVPSVRYNLCRVLDGIKHNDVYFADSDASGPCTMSLRGPTVPTMRGYLAGVLGVLTFYGLRRFDHYNGAISLPYVSAHPSEPTLEEIRKYTEQIVNELLADRNASSALRYAAIELFEGSKWLLKTGEWTLIHSLYDGFVLSAYKKYCQEKISGTP